MKQYITIDMDLILYKGIWDTNLSSVIAPIKQQIVFTSNAAPSFAFDVILDHTVPTKQYFNATWSTIIDKDMYKENENYSVIIEFYYEVKVGTTIEKCNGQNNSTKYKPLDTKLWICFNATSSNSEFINIKKLCDGIHDCSDSSDETATLCTPKYLHFEYIVLSLLVAFVICGIITFLVLQKDGYDSIKNENVNVESHLNVTRDIISICLECTEENYRKNKGLDNGHIQRIRQIYTPCQNDEEKKQIFKILFTMSLNDKIRNFVWQIFDEFIKMEEEVHSANGKAIRCMRFCKESDSYLSQFIKQVVERYDFFTKLGRKISNCLTLDCGPSSLYIKSIVEIAISLLHLVLFYYDVFKDIIVLYILSHIETSILTDRDMMFKFDTVGGINFQVLIIYLAVVLVISEAAIYWHIGNRKDMFGKTFNINVNSKVSRAFIRVFPMHFIFLQKCALNINNLFLENELKVAYREAFKRSKVFQVDVLATDIITISNKVQKMKHQLYHLNKLESEMQVLETALEREPQTVVQLCLFILMRRFKRIRLLFSSYLGISIETIFLVTWVLTMFSIANSVYGYLHSKRWPISPGFLGTIVQLLAIGGLVASKLLLIAITLLNAVYLHIFLYGFNMLIIFLYYKLFSGNMETYFEHTLVTGIAPAFYKSAQKASKSRIIRWCSTILHNYGIVINSVILHLITFLIYSSMGAILRNTMFHYNIKKNSGNNDDTMEHDNNGVTKQTGNEANQETQGYLDQIVFEQPLHNFPVFYVVVYMVCILSYALLSGLYYGVFHPWKMIMDKKNSVEDTKEGERQDNSQQVNDESSPEVEMSHL